ncbi:hypothetical protein [Streptomyces sp. NBC_00212]
MLPATLLSSTALAAGLVTAAPATALTGPDAPNESCSSPRR